MDEACGWGWRWAGHPRGVREIDHQGPQEAGHQDIRRVNDLCGKIEEIIEQPQQRGRGQTHPLHTPRIL